MEACHLDGLHSLAKLNLIYGMYKLYTNIISAAVPLRLKNCELNLRKRVVIEYLDELGRNSQFQPNSNNHKINRELYGS